MKLKDVLTEWDDWDDRDDLSGHHRAGASEAAREEIVNDIYQYINQPYMQQEIQEKYPRVASMKNMDVVADHISFSQVEGKSILDWLDDDDDDLTADDFEHMIDEALAKLEHTLGID